MVEAMAKVPLPDLSAVRMDAMVISWLLSKFMTIPVRTRLNQWRAPSASKLGGIMPFLPITHVFVHCVFIQCFKPVHSLATAYRLLS